MSDGMGDGQGCEEMAGEGGELGVGIDEVLAGGDAECDGVVVFALGSPGDGGAAIVEAGGEPVEEEAGIGDVGGSAGAVLEVVDGDFGFFGDEGEDLGEAGRWCRVPRDRILL